MSNIVPFQFENHSVRVVTVNNEPWFVVADIAKAIGHSDPRKLAEIADEDDRKKVPVIDALGRKQGTWVVNEPGVYQLLLGSNVEKAKPFRKWVTSEVLPSIRKTGGYSLSQSRAQLARDTARLEYRPMTDALKEEREKAGKETEWFHYSNEADLINRIVLGVPSAAFRLQHGIKKEENIRDRLTESQISAVMALQRANAVFVQMGMNFKARKEQLIFLFNRNHQHALIG